MGVNTGGPAFPYDYGAEGSTGMTLRDWFAGHALAAVGQRLVDVDGTLVDIQASIACGAYAVADAMLAERDK